jgi:hypothetical protein
MSATTSRIATSARQQIPVANRRGEGDCSSGYAHYFVDLPKALESHCRANQTRHMRHRQSRRYPPLGYEATTGAQARTARLPHRLPAESLGRCLWPLPLRYLSILHGWCDGGSASPGFPERITIVAGSSCCEQGSLAVAQQKARLSPGSCNTGCLHYRHLLLHFKLGVDDIVLFAFPAGGHTIRTRAGAGLRTGGAADVLSQGVGGGLQVVEGLTNRVAVGPLG